MTMNVRSQMASLAVLAVLVAACGPAMERVPDVSPITGEPYPEGVTPRETAETTTATLFLAQAEAAEGQEARDLYRRGLNAALEAVEDDPENPQGYWLAGIGHVGVDEYEEADRVWDRAQELYPAYELEIEPAREMAWVQALNQGIEAYNAGDIERARELWEGAATIFDRHPQAFANLGFIYAQDGQDERAIEMFREAVASVERPMIRDLEEEEIEERQASRDQALQTLGQLLARTGQYEEAEQIYREHVERDPDDVQARTTLALILGQMGRDAEALEIYEELLEAPGVEPHALFEAGVGLYQSDQFARAARAFERVTEMAPNNRDAWYFRTNALFAEEAWEELIPVGEQTLELDPLNRHVHLLIVGSYRDLGQTDRALVWAERAEELPVAVDNIQLDATQDIAQVQGIVEGNAASAGTPIQLRFTFYGESGQLGTETVTVNAPAEGETTNLQVSMPTTERATGYRYEVL